MSDWKERESLLSKFLTRKHTYHQDILSFCSFVYIYKYVLLSFCLIREIPQHTPQTS